MAKNDFCKWEEEPCSELRTNYPGKRIRSPYCKLHTAISFIRKKREQSAKDKSDLEKVREMSKKRTPRKEFYSSTAWKWFSKYVLLFYADENLMVRCATNHELEYMITDKRICVGHFIKVFSSNSSNYSTAFDFRNVLPQSDQENRFKNGNEPEMEKSINRIHGEGTSALLKAKSHEPFKLDKYELDSIAKIYRLKFKEELLKRRISNPWT